MAPGWFSDAVAALPGTDDPLFQRLWGERLLMFDGQQGVGDGVDDYSARLVAAARRRSARLLITLPDSQPHRPAFLFATALIRDLSDSSGSIWSMARPARVLYFGPTVGIRDQLRRTSVVRLQLNLAEVFSQQDVTRGAAGIGHAGSSAGRASAGLPRVVTVYAPADPVAVMRAYRPCWIAIDCSDTPSLVWLRPLMDEAVQRGVPVIAWGQNPLSECVNDFACYGDTFTWPLSLQLRRSSRDTRHGDIEALLDIGDSTRLSPLVLRTKGMDVFSALLRDAGQLLGHTTRQHGGRLGEDAIAVHWRYLRSLEALAVPVDFHEAEAPHFWGLRSLSQLHAVCQHFRAACMQSDPCLHRDLEEAATLLDRAKTNLQSEGCALWDALTDLCIEGPANDEARILLFSSGSRKQLFLFAMLARNNTTEDDLRDMGTHVASLAELRQWMQHRHVSPAAAGRDDLPMPPQALNWHPVLVGLLGRGMTPRLSSVFLHPKVDIAMYPHQCPSFARRQSEWSSRLGGDSVRSLGALVHLSGLPRPDAVLPPATRISVEQPVELNVLTATRTRTSLTGPMWQPVDTVSEVAQLFESDEEATSEELVLNEQAASGSQPTLEPSEEIWCPAATKVQFDQGWHAFFAPDDVINVVRGGALDLRYIGSVRVGERVLLIHGQQRQNLYDLIISRVHRHPSIELHVAMIRRWQEELRTAFRQWEMHVPDPAERVEHGARDLNGLLRRMRSRGSQLVCPLTLGFWLRGLVLCPLDPGDLRRVGEVLDMSFVRQYHERIVKAADRLRGLHRGLSHKLNRWLKDHATGAVNRSDDDPIDAELGLTFGDIRNSLLVLRVVEVQNVTGPFLRSNLGRAEKDMET